MKIRDGENETSLIENNKIFSKACKLIQSFFLENLLYLCITRNCEIVYTLFYKIHIVLVGTINNMMKYTISLWGNDFKIFYVPIWRHWIRKRNISLLEYTKIKASNKYHRSSKKERQWNIN